eukprot:6436552-Ditylum_brightwellii.AAC.1
MQFNTINHHHGVKNFIKARNVYIKPDQYKRNNVVMLIFPKGIWNPEYGILNKAHFPKGIRNHADRI